MNSRMWQLLVIVCSAGAVGGARWVTNEIDKKLLTVAASKAAAAPPAPEAAQQIVGASPAQALAIAQQL